ncbi:hypothetical protein AKUG0101_01310 [Apilactobacillus kunkeei]|nr:hypothetical protein AKUG0101_01310 [Apilactobacillus kunkeei]
MLLGSLCTTDHNQMVCAVGDGKCNISDWIVIDLTEPQETLKKAIDYFKGFDDLAAIGISSFGPLELRTYSSQYGYIKESSRPNWQNINYWAHSNIISIFQSHLQLMLIVVPMESTLARF